MSPTIKINETLCTQCGNCESSCPYGAIRMMDYPHIDEDSCRMCKSCIESCSAGVISLKNDNTEATHEINLPKANGIWVLAEHIDGNLSLVVTELLGTARKLAEKTSQQEVSAILIGHLCSPLAEQLFAYGADRVYLAEHPSLEKNIEDRHAEVLTLLARQYKPEILLIGATHFGRNVAPRVAVALNTGLTADCTELSIDPATGNLLQHRPAFGGNLMATIETPHHRPQMASVRPQVMKATEPEWGRKGKLIICNPEILPIDERITWIAEQIKKSDGSIIDSPVLIAGGRGMQNKKNIRLLYELADVLGGTVAASRAAVESGWLPVECQVGQTGKTVTPRLYIACGISGQIQHTAAIAGAQTVIAINNDAAAPIFHRADYGIVGDVTEIIPQLIREIKQGQIAAKKM